VQSATILIRLCDEITASNYLLSASWIAQHFLFNAALIILLDVKRANISLEEFISLQESVACIETAETLLRQSSRGSTPQNPHAIIIRLLFCFVIFGELPVSQII